MMNKLKLAKAKQNKLIKDKKIIEKADKALIDSILQFQDKTIAKLHEELNVVYNDFSKLLAKIDSKDYNQNFDAINNSLVSLIQKFEDGVNVNNIKEVENKTDLVIKNFKDMPKSFNVSNLKDIKFDTKGLATDKAVKKLEGGLANIANQLAQLDELLQPAQLPENFVPFRRVVRIGNRLQFDDSSWSGASGGGGGSSSSNGLTDAQLRATPVPVSGTVTATPTGTQNVDVTANTIGLATAANQLPDGHNVTVDNAIGAAAVPIQDGGNSITVDGTVAATQSGTWTEANSAAIKTAVETIDNAISGSEMQVDVVGALPAGTNAIGKLAANSGVDIGDVDVTSSVTSSLDHGSNLDIDTTAEQITSTSFACKFGVTVKADITNTGIIYIGNSDVTAGSTAATDGFPLSAGETLTLEVNNPNLLYAIASANNQKIYWVAN